MVCAPDVNVQPGSTPFQLKVVGLVTEHGPGAQVLLKKRVAPVSDQDPYEPQTPELQTRVWTCSRSQVFDPVLPAGQALDEGTHWVLVAEPVHAAAEHVAVLGDVSKTPALQNQVAAPVIGATLSVVGNVEPEATVPPVDTCVQVSTPTVQVNVWPLGMTQLAAAGIHSY